MVIQRVIFVTQVFCLLYTNTNGDTLYIKEGSNTTLICPFKSTIHKAQWVGPKSLTAYSDGSHLKNILTNYEKLRITGNNRIGEYNLEINNFSAADEGHYRCNNINGSSAVHVDYYLEIYRSPSNISVMNTSTDGLLEVNEGQSNLLSCTVESGNPAENMMWVHNDSILVFGGPKFLVYEFVPVVADHLQIYVCLANNSNTEATVEYHVQIYVKELPYTTIQPVGSTVIEAAKGKDIVLKCEYTTNVKPYNLTWIFNNDTILSESSDKVTLNGTLHLTNLSRKNTGTYRCNVHNTVGIGNAEVDVFVTYKPELASNDPFVFRTEIGKPAHISIPIRSFEKPTASWTLSSEESLQVGLLSVKVTQSDMFFIEGKIVPSTHHHFGKYGISVRNRVGSIHVEITLTYTDLRVLTSPRRYSCSTGNSTSINCFVNTNLYTKWSCVWEHFYNNEFIRSLPCTVKDGVSLLRFEFCNYMDTGIYKCILETPTWNFSSNAELSVKGPPIILSSVVERHRNNIVISTYFVSYSPAKDISWFFNNGKKESHIESNSTIYKILSSVSSADITIYDKKVHVDCIKTDLKLLDSHSVKEGWFVCLIRNRFGSRETVFNTAHNSMLRTLLKESLMTTDSHTDNILYSSMYPVNSSEVNDEVIDSAKDNSTVIFLIGGLTVFVALALAGAMWQYTAFLKGTTTIQTEIQISNGIALQNVRCSTSSDDIYEEICNENSEACQLSISGQEVEEEIDDKRLKVAGNSISDPYTNVYEDLNDAPKERNQNSENYKTISSEMPILDHSDDEYYLTPGPAYMIVIDPDQEKGVSTCDTSGSQLN
ncbi:hemicentin-1-like [Mytilus californianus]|uniref:hemicentin-1-like n=1 Tax=Mytilus californianus TaxID=6549 RepID=UPI002245A2CB|nr:hemicentin-1-like [Mytilus californianus]XP_052072410.1 hemicentin-1-like [Mytilus californianus]XP_052072411.1 hemicentin-1-like [Mytilus californianus]XP_052072413.1 hemicentin-1-like [Mytilus californianus]XP_052072414.1 hemicentin-1-like [Mytilus californianus]